MGERGLSRQTGNGESGGSEASAEQSLEVGQAVRNHLRVCTHWAATTRGQGAIERWKPAADGEGSSKGARAAGKAHLVPPGLACQMVGDGIVGNAANPGWLGLQNIRSRHAEQTGEVVRNHEVRTKLFVWKREAEGRLFRKAVWSGRATVMSAEGHERTNPRRGESTRVDSAVRRRSEGEARSMKAASPKSF